MCPAPRGACTMTMFRSLTTFLLFPITSTTMAGHSSAVAHDTPPIQQPGNGVGVVGHGRKTKFIQYDYTPCPQVPSLHCKNGSTCTPGFANFGKHDHLDLPTQDSGYHCKCLDGFIGHECAIEVEGCPGVGSSSDPQACYHGSSCRSSGGSSYCDCKELNAASGATDIKYEGSMCQHESTSLCAVSLVGMHAPNHQFCTNHGECVKMVAGGEPHPGCICKDGWMGNHCEISADPFSVSAQKAESGGGGNRAARIALLVVVIVVCAAVVILGSGLMAKNYKRKGETEGLTTFQSDASGTPEGEVPSDGTEDETVTGVVGLPKRTSNKVGEGDLDPDGSATLGNLAKEEDDDGELIEGYKPETEIV